MGWPRWVESGGDRAGMRDWLVASYRSVFNLFRTAFDASGAPVEVCEHVMSGDRWLLTYEWAAD
jgi:hypothetical protein